MIKKKSRGIIIQWLQNHLATEKAGNLAFQDSMDGPGECYAEGNKPVPERQIPYYFTYLCNIMNK